MKRRRFKLRWQLLLSYLPVMLAPIVVIGLVVRNVAEQGLTVLVTQEAQQRALAVSGIFTQYYNINGSWNGVETLFNEFRGPNPNLGRPPPLIGADNPPGAGPRRPQPGQLLIADNNGIVIASDDDSAKGQALSADALAHGAVLMVNGKQIGTLVIGAALGVLNEQEKQLLDSVSSALVLTGLLSSVAAVGLALWLSGQLTAPVYDLLAGVKQLASGHWSAPLAIRSQNEFADLTDAFNGMAEQLTRQQQQQRQMIADIAHDLRTPLSVIGLELEGIRAGLQTPEEATYSLQEEVDWLQHLIDDLHTLSLMDTGQFALHLDDTPLTPYLAALCEQWRALAVKQAKTLICDVPADLPVVQIDPFRMRQVLGNLLNNGLQHTPAGTQITLRASTHVDKVEISVADNGPGIAPDDLAHIFDRFYRADRARNRGEREHGSGLGLSIAHQLMQLHGGTLTIDSQPGKGTTFYVRLPSHPHKPSER
ncbi:MAG: ATP-binding protein [Aggregatilineales bacterium]